MTYLRLTPERRPSDADRGSRPNQADAEQADEMHRAAAARFERFERDRAAGEGMFDAAAPRGDPMTRVAAHEPRESDDMTDQTSDTDDAVIDHERTSEPELTWAQAGWTVYDRSGAKIGEIAERDDYSFVVLFATTGERIRVPTRLVAEGSAEDGRVTLTVGQDELERIDEAGTSDAT